MNSLDKVINPYKVFYGQGLDEELIAKQYKECRDTYTKFLTDYEEKVRNCGCVKAIDQMSVPTYLKLDLIEKDFEKDFDRSTYVPSSSEGLFNEMTKGLWNKPSELSSRDIDRLFSYEEVKVNEAAPTPQAASSKAWSIGIWKFRITFNYGKE